MVIPIPTEMANTINSDNIGVFLMLRQARST
jgi:hypothetical protein